VPQQQHFSFEIEGPTTVAPAKTPEILLRQKQQNIRKLNNQIKNLVFNFTWRDCAKCLVRTALRKTKNVSKATSRDSLPGATESTITFRHFAYASRLHTARREFPSPVIDRSTLFNRATYWTL